MASCRDWRDVPRHYVERYDVAPPGELDDSEPPLGILLITNPRKPINRFSHSTKVQRYELTPCKLLYINPNKNAAIACMAAVPRSVLMMAVNSKRLLSENYFPVLDGRGRCGCHMFVDLPFQRAAQLGSTHRPTTRNTVCSNSALHRLGVVTFRGRGCSQDFGKEVKS